MNYVANEIRSILDREDDDVLMHIGVARRSGRYPWGSGEDPYQRQNMDFLGRIQELKGRGMKETEIAVELGIVNDKGEPSTGRLRAQERWAKDEIKLMQIQTAKRYRDKEGMGPTEIGKAMGVAESTVRGWLKEEAESKVKEARQTIDYLREQVNQKRMVDVGTDVERELNISKERLVEALYVLENEGYKVYKGRIPQVTNPGKQTTQKVLCTPDVEHKEIYEFDKVQSLKDYISRDGGASFEKKFHYPESLDSKRLMVRYKEDGGIEKDGLVEIRRGVDDLSLGESRYSQVRIMVDGTHYIKGMAVYSDDLPDGVDVVFNTNKSKGTPVMGPKDNTVLKNIKKDPDNPFGSAIKDSEQGGQYFYDPDTGKRVSANSKNAKLGLINKRADEGDWEEWKDALPSQFLGKQAMPMIKKQLGIAKADKLAEYEEICSLTNPTIKKHMLEDFANNCDAAAVHLKAASLPGQKYHAILPVPSLKDTEVYAPNYKDGTKLALIRYPHGGTFEIPIVTVNNKHAASRKMIGVDPIDAICINSRVAERLSGADFDGDTVMAIPTHDSRGRVKITSTPQLPGLIGFDAKLEYPERAGMKYMRNTQTEMGVISNLITDMTLVGANNADLAKAVRHSMVVIDAEKHNLDYKKSEADNDIKSLKKRYQIKIDEDGNEKRGGASTILSRAKGELSVVKRQGTPKINIKGSKDYDPTKPEGALLYKTADDAYYPVRKYNKNTGEVTLRTTDGKKITYNINDKDAVEYYNPIKRVNDKTGEITFTNKSGNITYRKDYKKEESTRMAETDDAFTLVSKMRHPKEVVYAEYANDMKALANKARKEIVVTKKIEYSSTAKDTYRAEVKSLMDKLNDAKLNAPRERAAQRMANAIVKSKQETNPDMKKEDLKKERNRALNKARQDVNSISRRNRNIDITDREWEAIQAGAISENVLKQILNNTDADKLRERATPRATTQLSVGQINRIKAMSASYTQAQIAEKLNISPSAVSKALKGAS